MNKNAPNIEKFTNIYETKLWGSNNNQAYNGSSGGGVFPSHHPIRIYGTQYNHFIRNFINRNNIKVVADLGHGDWLTSEEIYNGLDVEYYGYDAYEKLCIYLSKQYAEVPNYNFMHCDIIADRELLKEGDLCILKDVLQHLTCEEIYLLLDYLCETKKYKYIMITNCCHQVEDNQELDKDHFRPLTANKLPLKKYSPVVLNKYLSKEISLITN